MNFFNKILVEIFIISIFLLVGISSMSQTNSPELVSSAGDSFIGANCQIDWSVGELASETYTGTQNMLTQGFHQSSYIITTIDRNADFKYTITAFPNPTNDFISLNLDKLSDFGKVNYTIKDITGKELHADEILSDIEQINFSNYPVGIYIVTVLHNNQLMKSFQIIKN